MPVSSCLPLAGRSDGTFARRGKSTQKRFFADRTAIRGSKAGSRLCYRVCWCRLPVCSGLLVSSAVAECAKCSFGNPLYAKSLQTFFASVLDRRYLFVFNLSCRYCKLSAYRKVCFHFAVKGEGDSPSLFCLLVPFPHGKGTSPLFLLGKKRSFLPLGRGAGSFLPPKQGNGWRFSPKREWYFA